MECKLIYNNREFETEDQINSYLQNTEEDLLDANTIYYQAGSTSGEQAATFAERWGLKLIDKQGAKGFVPKGGIVTRKLVKAMGERLKKVGGVYDKITPVYDATHGFITFRNEQGEIMFQEAEGGLPKASPQIVAKVREFLKRIGVNINEVREITGPDGQVINANAQANLLKSIIDIVEGKEDVAITEEAMHFAVEILEQTNPTLFNQMMNKVGQYAIYDQVLGSPVYRKQYALPDGKINVRAMKKEALGKIIAATYLSQNDQTIEKPELISQAKDWWTRVKEWFKKVFQKADFNPFEEAARQIDTLENKNESIRNLAKEISEIESSGIFASIFKEAFNNGDYSDALDMYAQQLRDPATYQTTIDKFLGGRTDLAEKILELSTPMLQATSNPAVDEIYNKMMSMHQRLTLTRTGNKTGDSYYSIDGRKIRSRVTDKVNAYYEKALKGRLIGRTEAQEAIDDQKKDKGTHGHSDMEALFHRYVDDNGHKRAIPLEMPTSQLDPSNSTHIQALDEYMKDLINSYPEGTRFLAETRIYSPAGDQAGTIDFTAINGTTGEVDIRDWKFMDLKEGTPDVPWYKKEAFNIQISEYKNMLKKNYGVNKFGKTRAIPIITKYKWSDWQTKDKLVLSGIRLGSQVVTEIGDLKLLPVATKDESTGDASVDAFLKKLNALYDKLAKEKVEEGRRDVKAAKLAGLERAIRTLQIQKANKDLRQSATAIISSVSAQLAKYKKILETTPNPTPQQVREIAQRILEDYDIVEVFKGLDRVFRNVEMSEEDRAKIKEISDKASDIIEDISQEKGLSQQVADIVANGYGIKDLLIPERILPYLKRNFRSLSQAGTAATRVLWNMQQRIKTGIAIEHDEQVKELAKHKEAIEKAAEAKGVSIGDLLKKMLSYKDGRWTGKLIGRTNPEFYEKLKQAQKDADKKWIGDNVDMAAYTKWFTDKYAEQIKFEETQTYDWQDQEANVAERQRRLQLFTNRYDPRVDSAFSAANDRLLSFPKQDIWKSKELTELEGTPALLAFYEYWERKMKESYKMGMIQGAGHSRFVANVKRTQFEKQFEGVGKGSKKQITFFNDMLADEEQVSVDALTGKPIDHIAPLYLFDLGERVTNDKGESYVDYSQKSDDLFKIMSLWTAEMAKFKYRTEVETEARIIQRVERAKAHVVHDKKSKIDHVVEGNEENARYFDNFMNAMLYGRKYTEKSDATTTININNYIRGINKGFKKVFGYEPLPLAADDELEFSATKTIEKANRYFQMKTLGFNVASSITNYLGGKTNAYINAGRDITRTDLWDAETRLASGAFKDKEGNIAAGLVDYFMPLTDDEKMEKSRALSVKGIVSNLSSDWLFYLQRKSTRYVEIPIFLAYAKNTMVENGKLVNIRRYVKNKNGYGEKKYSLSRAERDQFMADIEKEIKELQDSRSLIKISKIENDRLVIPGIDRNSDTVYEFRNMVQQFSKDALGNMDQDDFYQYRMSILMKSMMMFKNWIPRMIDVRFGGLRYEVGKDDWEWGRVNMLWNGLVKNLVDGTGALMGIASGEESLIDRAKKLYIIKQSEFGEQNFMSEAEFVDMYVRGATQVVKEIITVLSLMGMVVGVAAAVPDDDNEVTKGAHKWTLRIIDKSIDELSFFYNPIAISSIANGSIFPAMGVAVDLQRFALNLGKDTFYTVTGNEEGQEKTKTLKYLFKGIPITKELATYMALFSHEFADSFGVQVSTQARPR